MSQEDVASNRSALREFLASIATISGDLSNITAPPFVLLENSTVELPQYQADHTELFLAPATEDDPAQRALLVLKNFLSSLRNQQYAGRSEDAGVKKPLNAFLGELFLGSWRDEELGETRLLTEQVSHHPPITACYIWNEKLGISAQGFTQQEITFSGNVHIKQKGYALLHLDKYDEDFLIPVPNVKVKGILTGPYPELHGEYNLISSSGYVSHIKFEGKGFFGSGTKNGFHARMFHVDRPKDDIYTIEGAWNGVFKITSSRADEPTETFDVNTMQARKLQVAPLDEQDPWESQRAWQHTIAALRRGDMRRTTDSKSKIEEGQRQMRRDEDAAGQHWQPLFYTRVEHDAVFDKLAVHDTGTFTVEARTGGIWKINRDAVNNVQRPFHGELTPSNRPVGETASAESSRRGSGVSHRSGSNASSAANSLHAAAVNGRARANGNGNASPRTSMSGPSSSRSSSEARRKSSSSEAARRSFSSVSSRRSGEIPTEEMRALGISEGTPEHAKTNGAAKHKSRPSSGYFEQMKQAAWSVTAAAGSLIGVGGGTAAATKTVDDGREEDREVAQPVREPTDGEVEMYLRVKHSNLH